MRRNSDQWMNLLQLMFEGSDYDVMMNGGQGNSQGVAIVPKNCCGPQRICIYPKKTKGAGLVIEMDVYNLLSSKGILQEYGKLKSNRPHYGGLSDEIIIEACSIFLENF